MAIDPICKMTVDETKAIRVTHDTKDYLFCSAHCKEKYMKDHPDSHQHSHHVPKGEPVQPAPAVQSQKTIYTCPMHPEIEQDHPGDCPKCGMALEPKNAS